MGERLEQISKELESLKEQLSALEGKAQGDIEVKQMQLNLVSADDEVLGSKARNWLKWKNLCECGKPPVESQARLANE
ncbi:MAG: hypothetical protein ACLUKN_00455 [Bacilli bacterium]